MGNESDKKPQLTLNDPVDQATLTRIGEIQNRRLQLGDMLLDLEQEKVKILVEGRRLDDERARLFANILGSRGLHPTVPVEIDPATGKISLMKVNGVQAQAPSSDAPAGQPAAPPPPADPPPQA
jgi:hypothetical protein